MGRGLIFESRQGALELANNIFKVVEESNENLDLSIILNREEAEYLYELFGYSEHLTMQISDIDNDFGNISNKCLISIFKTGNVVEVLAEDIYQIRNGEKVIKYHETETLIVAREDVQLVQKYVVTKVIVVDFVSEKEHIKSLIFD